jgi:hypothetical protein
MGSYGSVGVNVGNRPASNFKLGVAAVEPSRRSMTLGRAIRFVALQVCIWKGKL